MAGPYEENYFALNQIRKLLVGQDVKVARYHNVSGSLMPRKVTETLGFGVHRSGWAACVEHIAQCNLPVLIDDFVERTFMARNAGQFHRRKFVGIFHYPPDLDLPEFVPGQSDIRHTSIFGTRAWKLSRENLVMGVCLSHHLEADLRTQLNVPFFRLTHPTEIHVKLWDITRFLERPTIVQVGAFYRDTRSIARLELGQLKALRLLDLRYDWINQWDKLVGNALGPSRLPSNIIHINRIDDSLYDELFASCIIHTNYVAASASNVVVEAIARNTPLLVNRHPAIVEYLGSSYPLYQEDLYGAKELIDRAKAAHAYLSRIDKREYGFDTFKSRLSNLLSAKENC